MKVAVRDADTPRDEAVRADLHACLRSDEAAREEKQEQRFHGAEMPQNGRIGKLRLVVSTHWKFAPLPTRDHFRIVFR